ncbi:MAG: DNA polymerase, partial [Verrucomicrobiota bacterium]
VDMEVEGVALDVDVLSELSGVLEKNIESFQAAIFETAGCTFNLNSPKQLGEVLFDKLKIVDKPKKTKTGQYATNEQVLQGLAHKSEIVQQILDYREASKLKSTYVDALPGTIFARTNHVHTTYSQAGAATGRLASSNPNLQNIPIRTEQGQQIRKAFVARGEGFSLLAADYSQVELRVMAEMSGDAGLREAFESGHDIHAATAAKVYGTELDEVTADMRRTAKMVNFGIMYGISAFGLSQRLGIPRKEEASIIDQYFIEFEKVKTFMDSTIASCRENGFVETLTGRRRYIRDINSANATTRSGAERTAINSPIQGTAADMIKLAMNRIHEALNAGGFKTRMILQVHDELIFDLFEEEEARVRPLVEDAMKNAIPFSIPVEVDMGTGKNWLEAH